MEDQVLSSMCIDPVSYYTFAEQREAFIQHKTPQREISLDGNTYICMIVPILCRHWVAVQITITPFSVEQFPGQTFFSSQFRCGPCCCQIDHTDTSDIVRDTVQKVIDSSYRSVCWNYSSKQCCTLDHPTNTDIEQCIPVVKSRFQAYTESTYPGLTSLARNYPPTSERHAQDSSIVGGQLVTANRVSSQSLNIENLLDTTNPTNIESHSSQSQPSSISSHNGPNGTLPPAANLKRKAGTGPTELTTARPRKQRISREESDAKLVQKVTNWVEAGLENLSTERFPTLVTLSDILPTQPKDETYNLTDHLWKRADEVENASTTVVWSLRYIAACSSLVGTVFTSSSEVVLDRQSAEPSRQSISNWRGFVEVVNSIINEMLQSWKDKAYLLYHVFAAKGNILSNVARLSEARRKGFSMGVVNALKLFEPPSGFEGVSLFNPTRVLSGLLHTRSHEEICRAIGLPSAITSGTIEGEKSISLIPNMTALCRQVNDFHLLKAKLKSGVNFSSTFGRSPPPTPPTRHGANFNLSVFMAPTEADRLMNTLPVTHDAEIPTTTTDAGASLTQIGECRPSHTKCSAARLAPVDATGLLLPEKPLRDTARQGSDGTNLHEGTRAPSPVLNLDSDYGFDGSAFENSEFFRPLFDISDGAFDGGA